MNTKLTIKDITSNLTMQERKVFNLLYENANRIVDVKDINKHIYRRG